MRGRNLLAHISVLYVANITSPVNQNNDNMSKLRTAYTRFKKEMDAHILSYVIYDQETGVEIHEYKFTSWHLAYSTLIFASIAMLVIDDSPLYWTVFGLFFLFKLIKLK